MAALAIRADGSPMPFGTPGGDVQAQAMLQVLLNMIVFDMNPQQAVEAPRFASYSFPDSFEPHSYSPGRAATSKAAYRSGARRPRCARPPDHGVARVRVARRRGVRAARRSVDGRDLRGCRSAPTVLRGRLVAAWRAADRQAGLVPRE